MLPDLNRLKIFSLVYLNKSVSGAAREMNLSQPAVSQHLKKLEQELKIPLFTRTNKKMIPTPAAIRLHDRVAPFIAELQNEVKYLRRPLDTPYGQLRIGSPPLFTRHYLPVICNHFRFRFPTVTFKLQQDNKETQLSDVLKGQLDFAIIGQLKHIGPKKQIDPILYSTTKLFEEDLVLTCSNSYYQRKVTGKTDYETFKNLEYITAENQNMLLCQWFRHHFRKTPFNLNHVLTSDDQHSTISGIRCGMGLGIVPSHIIRKEVETGALVVINAEKKQLKNTLSLVQLKNKKRTLTEKAFISVLQKELAKSPVNSSLLQPPTKQ